MEPGLKVLSSMATARVLSELSALYETRLGQKVIVESVGGVLAAERVRGGETSDVVVLASGVMADLERAGHVSPGTTADIVRSGMAVAVPSGSAHPNLSDEGAMRAAVLAGKRIAYSTGPSGRYFLRLCEGWGVSVQGSDRLIEAPAGVPVGELLARGDADLGVQQLSELLNVADIEIVGPLPPEIQLTTVFSAGIASNSSQPELARELIAFLAGPLAADVKRSEGMEPA